MGQSHESWPRRRTCCESAHGAQPGGAAGSSGGAVESSDGEPSTLSAPHAHQLRESGEGGLCPKGAHAAVAAKRF
eukprot:11714664-Alexandrium_andersonii.AAC.1